MNDISKIEKVKRGKQILEYYEQVCRDSKADAETIDYCEEILHSVSLHTYDTPIPLEDMCLALAEAEEQGKRVYVVPKVEDLGNGIIVSQINQLDGWEYKIEIR